MPRLTWPIPRPYFNPRSPCGERRVFPTNYGQAFISIRAPLAGSDIANYAGQAMGAIISIRAPLAGSDGGPDGRPGLYVISIRAPLAGSDDEFEAMRAIWEQFQSALPLRGATGSCFGRLRSAVSFQSALPLRGATHRRLPSAVARRDFNPRSPCGERPIKISGGEICIGISIRAPLAGSDAPLLGFEAARLDFNPRSPCGERHSR